MKLLEKVYKQSPLVLFFQDIWPVEWNLPLQLPIRRINQGSNIGSNLPISSWGITWMLPTSFTTFEGMSVTYPPVYLKDLLSFFSLLALYLKE